MKMEGDKGQLIGVKEMKGVNNHQTTTKTWIIDQTREIL